MLIAAYITFFVAMIAIMNPIGNLAIFVTLVSDRSIEEQKDQAKWSAVAVLIILLLVTWLGNYILGFFGISDAAFETAGALIIILLGLSMMRGHDSQSGQNAMRCTEEEKVVALTKESISVVPVAIPIVAGPGAMTTIIIHSSQFPTLLDKGIISLICVALALIIYMAFSFSAQVSRVLGFIGIKIATRVMGLILVAIAFQMLGSGLVKLLPGLA
jgi:multiple antibiotic resistance protein